jgi:hypothetical protein
MNQCIRLVESLTEFAKTRPVREIKQAMVGLVSILGNLRSVQNLFRKKILFSQLICFKTKRV